MPDKTRLVVILCTYKAPIVVKESILWAVIPVRKKKFSNKFWFWALLASEGWRLAFDSPLFFLPSRGTSIACPSWQAMFLGWRRQRWILWDWRGMFYKKKRKGHVWRSTDSAMTMSCVLIFFFGGKAEGLYNLSLESIFLVHVYQK